MRLLVTPDTPTLFPRRVAPQGRTRLLVTHQRQFLPACDRVVVLRGGRVFADGTFAELAPLRLPELAGSEGAAASLDDAAYDAGVGAGGTSDPNPGIGQTLSAAWDRSGGASAEPSAPASEAGGDADPDASRNPSKSPSTSASSLAELSAASAATAPAAGGAGEPAGTADWGAMPCGEAGPAAGPGPGSGSQGAAQRAAAARAGACAGERV